MSDDERERQEPAVLSARKAMSLLGEAPAEPGSSDDEPEEPSPEVAGEPEDGS